MSRRNLILFSAVGLVAANGCTSCTPNPCTPSGIGPLTSPPTIVADVFGNPFLDHSPVQVSLTVPANGQCLVPESATVTVTDPSEQNVGANASLSADKSSVNITFESGIPGWYYVQADVQPNIGLTQQQVLVVENRLDAGPPSSVTTPAGGQCNDLGRTTAGTWVCDGLGGGIQDDASFVAGDVVWTYNSGQGTGSDFIQRYVDDGGSLVATLSPAPDAGIFGLTSMTASPDDAIYAHGSNLFWFHYDADAGTARLAGNLQLPPPFPSAPQSPVVLLLQGTTLVATANVPTPFILDAGTFDVSALTLGAGGFEDAGFSSLTGEVVGTDGQVFWIVGDGSGRLSAYTVDGGSLAFAASTPLSQDLNPPDVGSLIVSTSPLAAAHFQTLAPLMEGSNVSLQLYDATGTLQGANQRFVWESGSTETTVLVFPR